MRRLTAKLLLLACVIGLGAVPPCRAASPLLDEATLITASGQAQPFTYTFITTSTTPLTITLTDQQVPAAFQSLAVAVTLGNTLVGTATVDASSHVATLTIPGTAGTYQVEIVGTPATQAYGSFGSFGVCTALQSSPSTCIAADSTSGTIQAPSTVSTTGQSTLNTTFTSTVAGTYNVTLIDDAFPTALTGLVGGITQGSTPIAGPILPSATPTQVTLAAATTYNLLIGANANSTTLAGLYGILITDPTGASIFARSLPVGELTNAVNVSNPSSQSVSLTLTDLAYPQALTAVGAAVTHGAALLGELTASGATSFAAASGTLQVWQYASSGTAPGAYNLTLTSSAGSLYATTQVVNPASPATATSFAFAATLPTAGTYHLSVTDFQYPVALSTLTSTIAENGTVIAASSGGNFTAAAGTVIVLVDATPAPNSTGVFSVAIAPTASSTAYDLDQTQAVGTGFSTTTLDVVTAGEYNVSLTDLAFPTSFENLAVVVSQGGTVLGRIYAGGNFNFSATPGTYVLTYLESTGTGGYGLLGIDVSSTPPTVTLTSNTTSVPAGQSVQLSWTSTNATACTASGATDWTGSEPTSGNEVAVAVSAATNTLTLTCTGPGGSAAASVVVTTTPVTKTGSGGGALGCSELALLVLLGGARAVRIRRARAPKRTRSRPPSAR
jgi:hypothetical protein